ncbi:MAG: hypothetical protein JRF63_11165 [Deltaproteobacteria bacterium]|nr:hypothetical protein [Deltaproteobacteria bacterium]
MVLAVGFTVACGDEPKKDSSVGGNYTECTDAPQTNPITICDSMMVSVEDLCGFSLTVDACACYNEVAPCAVSSEGISEVVMAFLEGILACEDSSATCSEYMTCLEVLGEVDNCDNPVNWSCITTTEGQEQTEE